MSGRRAVRMVVASVVAVAVAAAVAGCAANSAAPPNSAARSAGAPPGSVVVELLDVQSARGLIRVALHRDARGFPGASAFGRKVAKASTGTVRIAFDGVPPGPFAVAVHHDENGDGRMNTGPFGVPQEGYGFSRDASAPFGPPSFAAATITLEGGARARVRVRMRY